MNEKKKLTDEEINSISEIRQKTSEKIMQFGEIELELIYLENRKEEIDKIKNNLKVELKTLQDKEKDISTKLNEKYGQGTLNLDNKEFIPA